VAEYIVIDRIEENIAVCEIGDKTKEIPLSDLPKGVGEGTVLKITKDGYVIDKKAEIERRNRIFEKQNNLFR